MIRTLTRNLPAWIRVTYFNLTESIVVVTGHRIPLDWTILLQLNNTIITLNLHYIESTFEIFISHKTGQFCWRFNFHLYLSRSYESQHWPCFFRHWFYQFINSCNTPFFPKKHFFKVTTFPIIVQVHRKTCRPTTMNLIQDA